MQAKFQSLLARVYEKSNNLDMSLQTLGQAKQLRARILKRVQVIHWKYFSSLLWIF